MRLLLDLGNTRLKWGMSRSPENWLAQGVVDWHGDTMALLASSWSELPRPSMVVAASVVDAARETLTETQISRLFDCQVTWLRTPANACGVRNAYADPGRLGVDRFLGMVAAKAAGAAPCVLASAGTALTLDALAADGQHLGGLIAPGIHLMQRSLVDATAQVRPQQAGDILDIADNTADAMMSGSWQAAAALIERFVTRLSPRLGGAPTLLLTGGDAARLLPLLSLPAQLLDDGVLRGLGLWADAHMTLPSSV
jgi:type III pantothenate kinase